MRRTFPPVAALSVLVLLALWLTLSSGAPGAGASQIVPTPRGQLGGPEPLPTGSGAPSEPEPTATQPPAGAACAPAPISVDRLVAAVAAATPASTPVAWEIAAPATPEQAEAARSVILTLVACANDNDPARTYALYTDAGIARSLARQGIPVQAAPLLLAASGAPLPDAARARLAGIDRVLAAADDRLRAEFTLLERDGIGELRAQAYVIDLVRAGETWLIDDVLPR